VVIHVVLFKLGDRSPESVARTAAILRSMAGRIPSLAGVHVGIDQTRSERSYDLALTTHFDSWAAYDEYRVHPYHRDTVLAHLAEAAESAAVVDYESLSSPSGP
jgi:hypothetical protein